MDHDGKPEPLANPLTVWGAVGMMLAVACIAGGFVVLALAYGICGLVTKLSSRPAALQNGRGRHTDPEHRCVQVELPATTM